MGLTSEAHLAFFVYLPKTSANTVEFILNDAEEKEVYQSSFNTPIHYASPKNLQVTTEWIELLRSAGLSEISEQVLINP